MFPPNPRRPLLAASALAIALTAVVLAGCGSSSEPTATAATTATAGGATTGTAPIRKADLTYALPLVVRNTLPVDVQVTPQDPRGPWEVKPDAQRTTIADGESTTLRLRPRTYWSQDDSDWGTLTPGPLLTLAVNQRGQQETASLSLAERYVKRTILIDEWASTFAVARSWVFGMQSATACGPATPGGGVALTYANPSTGEASTATISIDCPANPRDGDPPTVLTLAP
jgi:hypothetical protein